MPFMCHPSWASCLARTLKLYSRSRFSGFKNYSKSSNNLSKQSPVCGEEKKHTGSRWISNINYGGVDLCGPHHGTDFTPNRSRLELTCLEWKHRSSQCCNSTFTGLQWGEQEENEEKGRGGVWLKKSHIMGRGLFYREQNGSIWALRLSKLAGVRYERFIQGDTWIRCLQG